jgi:hypothetical protein
MIYCADSKTKVHRRFPQWRESVQFARSPLDEPFSDPLYPREMPRNRTDLAAFTGESGQSGLDGGGEWIRTLGTVFKLADDSF